MIFKVLIEAGVYDNATTRRTLRDTMQSFIDSENWVGAKILSVDGEAEVSKLNTVRGVLHAIIDSSICENKLIFVGRGDTSTKDRDILGVHEEDGEVVLITENKLETCSVCGKLIHQVHASVQVSDAGGTDYIHTECYADLLSGVRHV